jgi:hypothetical protein
MVSLGWGPRNLRLGDCTVIAHALRSKFRARGPLGFAADAVSMLAAVGVVTVCLAVALIATAPVAVRALARGRVK